MLLWQWGLVKTSSGPKFDYSWQLHRHIFKGLENLNHIAISPYLQNILPYGWTLSSHKIETLRLFLSKLWRLQHAQSAREVSALRVWLFCDKFPVAPLRYINHVKAVYRQRIYYYLVKFSGMLHDWLQRYHTRIRTLRSSLVPYLCPRFWCCQNTHFVKLVWRLPYLSNVSSKGNNHIN